MMAPTGIMKNLWKQKYGKINENLNGLTLNKIKYTMQSVKT